MGILFDVVKKDKDYSVYSKTVNLVTRQNKSLYTAFFQLTPFCNLKCRMCYARLEPRDVSHAGKKILRFDRWKFFIDEAIKEGLSELSFTGGECTLHPDFCKIYSYAYDQGIQIAVMTNASYITDQIFALWKNKPPKSISITIYGATADTYDFLCGNRAAFDKVYQNIEKLDKEGFYLHLKYTAVNANLNELLLVDRYCREMGYTLYPSNVLTRFDRCTSNVLESEHANEDAFNEIMRQIRMEREHRDSSIIDKKEKEEPKKSCNLDAGNKTVHKGVVCSAARNSCYIDWEGRMMPCVAFDAIKLDPAKTGFHECWKELIQWADQIPVLEECVGCKHKYKCNRCIALHFNDMGVFNTVSPRLCWKRNHPDLAKEIEME